MSSFSDLRFQESFSVGMVFLDLEPPPRVISWRNVSLPPSPDNGLFVLPDRHFCYLSKSQSLTLIGNPHRTIHSILDNHLRGLGCFLDLVKLMVVSHRKVISQSSLGLDTQDRIKIYPPG